MEETFHYDKMNRLTDIYLGSTHSQIVYDPLGRMTSKQADGQTVFANASYTGGNSLPPRPHALRSAETTEGVFPAARQDITYTSFDKVKTITEGGNILEYTYGYDHQRIRMASVVNDTIRCKDYVGMCEYITVDDGENVVQKTRTYLMGPFGVFAVVEQQDEEESIHYILKDNLGSWTTITDAEGNVEQEISFDAWGNLRDPETWSGSFSGSPMFDRGYTGHEHMTAFGLINMNGRIYDPVLSSFLSVDNYVQCPNNSQNFNRYAYCLYNPLRFIDPSGWLPGNGNGIPDIPPGLDNYSPGIYNSADSDYAYSVCLPEVGIVATSLGADVSNSRTNYTMGNNWSDNQYYSYFESATNEYTVQHSATINHGSGGNTSNAVRNGKKGNKKGKSLDGAVASLTTMWAVSLAEPTPFGEIISAAVTAAASIYYSKELYIKMSAEIEHLLERQEGPDGYVYELRAKTDGVYPCLNGTASFVYLNANEIWKIGETTQVGGGRYSREWLNSIGAGGVKLISCLLWQPTRNKNQREGNDLWLLF